jgi:hypothetical protein
MHTECPVNGLSPNYLHSLERTGPNFAPQFLQESRLDACINDGGRTVAYGSRPNPSVKVDGPLTHNPQSFQGVDASDG